MSQTVPNAVVTKLQCAKSYVERGWHIFVLGANKTPLPNCPACHTAGPEHDPEECTCLSCHGFYAATTDLTRVELMLTLNPSGELALRTGRISGVVVIDAEGDSDGPDMPSGVEVMDAWETWVGGWSLQETLTAITPGEGAHRYYVALDAWRSHNRVLPSVDVKGEAGYVLLPSGSPGRRWLNELEPATPNELLADWLSRATGRSYGSGDGHAVGYDYQQFAADGCPGGFRDEFFNDMVWRLRRQNTGRAEAEVEVRKHWERAAQPPNARYAMPWSHVVYKLDRVWRTVAPDEPLPTWRPRLEVVDRSTDDLTSVPLTNEVLDEARHEFASDTGNAHRFANLHGKNIRFVPETRTWLVWDGVRWAPDTKNEVLRRSADVATSLRRQAEISQDPDEARQFARNALAAESLRARRAMVELAATLPEIVAPADTLDSNPLLLVTTTGVVDLKTGELRSAQRNDLCARIAGVPYDPDAQCKRWREHVRFVTKGDPLLASYLRRAAGYSLTGLVHEHAFFMLEGTGANGKNAFIEPILAVMGDYAQTGTSALLTGGDEQHPTILADLVGARMVFVDEARKGKPLNVERVKMLTGSKRIKARRMGHDFFEFDAHLKLWIAGNSHPTVSDSSDGIWRRLHRIMFNAKVTEGKKIADYGQVLFDEEGPGILNWLLEGLRDWWTVGMGEPNIVKTSTLELRNDEDFIAQFMDEMCVVTNDPTDRVSVNELYIEFSIWAMTAGIKASEKPNRVQFGRELGGRGLGRWQSRVNGVVTRGYEGLKIVKSLS